MINKIGLVPYVGADLAVMNGRQTHARGAAFPVHQSQGRYRFPRRRELAAPGKAEDFGDPRPLSFLYALPGERVSFFILPYLFRRSLRETTSCNLFRRNGVTFCIFED